MKKIICFVTILLILTCLTMCFAGCAEKNTTYYRDGSSSSKSWVKIIDSDKHTCQINDLILKPGDEVTFKYNGIPLTYDATKVGNGYTFTIKAKTQKEPTSAYKYFSGTKQDNKITFDKGTIDYKK